MKKLTFLAIAAIATLSLTSCGNARPPKADLKTDIDTLSYSLGVGLGEELKNYNIIEQMGVDSANMADFMRGLNEAVAAGEDKAKIAYYAGLQLGNDLNNRIIPNMEKQFFADDSTKAISRDNLMAALLGVLTGKEGPISTDSAMMLQQRFMEKQREIQMKKQQEEMEKQQAEYLENLDKENREKFAENRQAGEKFLAENKTKDGVQTTESGLQYKVLTKGTGAIPTELQSVKVEYEGRLIDGTVFDASSQHGDGPSTLAVARVIKGWKEALQMMPVGSEWEIYVPQELAYGPQDTGNIKPYSALIFKLKLVDIAE